MASLWNTEQEAALEATGSATKAIFEKAFNGGPQKKLGWRQALMFADNWIPSSSVNEPVSSSQFPFFFFFKFYFIGKARKKKTDYEFKM